MAENPRLMVLSENFRGRIFDLSGDCVSCGRKPEMEICIKDGSLSSHHCDFVRRPDGGYRLRDNHSTNGTRVNGRAVEECDLESHDAIRLGGVEMVYVTPGNGGETTVSRTHTIVIQEQPPSAAVRDGIDNLSPFEKNNRKREARQRRLIFLLLFLLGVAVLGLIAALLLLFAGNTPAY